jgi:hypothetical protein
MNTENLRPGDILTPQELAKRLKVDLHWVYEKSRRRGRFSGAAPLPVLKFGRYLRFAWPDVLQWMRNETEANYDPPRPIAPLSIQRKNNRQADRKKVE